MSGMFQCYILEGITQTAKAAVFMGKLESYSSLIMLGKIQFIYYDA